MATTARAKIDTAAAEHGWTAQPREGVWNVIEYRKGRRYVAVYYKVTDVVQSASHAKGRISGTNKAERVIAVLSA